MMFGIFSPLKGNKNQWLEFPGTLVFFSISWQKGLNPEIRPLKFLLQ